MISDTCGTSANPNSRKMSARVTLSLNSSRRNFMSGCVKRETRAGRGALHFMRSGQFALTAAGRGFGFLPILFPIRNWTRQLPQLRIRGLSALGAPVSGFRLCAPLVNSKAIEQISHNVSNGFHNQASFRLFAGFHVNDLSERNSGHVHKHTGALPNVTGS